MASNTLSSRLLKNFGNKYFVVLVLFAGWIIFFDKHDVITQFRLQRTVNKLELEKEQYREKIKQAQQDQLDLENNTEKYARERYYMKRGDEDVFIIERED